MKGRGYNPVMAILLAGAQIDDDELAACLAAIQICLSTQVGTTAGPKKPQSNWGRAARLEAVRKGQEPFERPPVQSKSDKEWSSPNLPKLSIHLAAAGILFALQLGCAQTANSQDVPPLAPDFRQSGSIPAAPDYRNRPPIASKVPPAPPSVPNYTQSPVTVPDYPGSPYLAPTGPKQPQMRSEEEQAGMPPASAIRMPSRIRVGLAMDATTLDIGLPDGAIIKDDSGAILAELPPQSKWQLAFGGNGQITFNGTIGNVASSRVAIARQNDPYKTVGFTRGGALPQVVDSAIILNSAAPQFWLPVSATSGSYTIEPSGDNGLFGFKSKLYRGNLRVQLIDRKGSTVLGAINDVDLEDYLLSVVPSEMPGSWPLEALKAQAIAARSYALSNIGKNSSSGFDVKATNEDQVYNGVSSEQENTNRAVAETAGLVMRNQGKIVTAFFHSTSGGYTEVSENVWSKPLPFLKSVPDYDDESPHFAWTRTLSTGDVATNMRKAGKDVGSILAVMPVSRVPSQRVKQLLVAGTDRTVFLTGEESRRIFALPSTNFNIGSAPDAYVFAGRGFGHGLGMSQWGAKKLASDGYNAAQILSYYYKEITLEHN